MKKRKFQGKEAERSMTNDSKERKQQNKTKLLGTKFCLKWLDFNPLNISSNLN
jgi:hypothetical protein